jgi:hypothetical protein
MTPNIVGIMNRMRRMIYAAIALPVWHTAAPRERATTFEKARLLVLHRF